MSLHCVSIASFFSISYRFFCIIQLLFRYPHISVISTILLLYTFSNISILFPNPPDMFHIQQFLCDVQISSTNSLETVPYIGVHIPPNAVETGPIYVVCLPVVGVICS
eukprot:390506_1